MTCYKCGRSLDNDDIRSAKIKFKYYIFPVFVYSCITALYIDGGLRLYNVCSEEEVME